MPLPSVTVYYGGIVQHVHFRAMILRLARRFSVKGWVQNQADGCTVIAHFEGAFVRPLLESIPDIDLTDGLGYVERIESTPFRGHTSFQILDTPHTGD